MQALLDLLVAKIEDPAHPGAEGEVELKLDFEDEIVAGACTVRDGEIVNPGAKAAVEASGSSAPSADTPGPGTGTQETGA